MSRELSCPPSDAVCWVARHEATRTTTIVTSRTWFDARYQAAIRLGCSPFDLEVHLATVQP
jgi:hypothetical protein